MYLAVGRLDECEALLLHFGLNVGGTMRPQDELQPLYNLLRNRIQSSIDLKRMLQIDGNFNDSVVTVALKIVGALRDGGKVLFFGNGGSAADSQHLAAEFTGRYLRERPAVPALALSTNSSSVTAIGNDYGFDLIFARQLEALGKPGDVAVGISTSGNSRNVIRALEAAKARSIFTVALTGATGGMMKGVADCTICIPSEETPRIQECHILTGHLICETVEQLLFENSGSTVEKNDAAVMHARLGSQIK